MLFQTAPASPEVLGQYLRAKVLGYLAPVGRSAVCCFRFSALAGALSVVGAASLGWGFLDFLPLLRLGSVGFLASAAVLSAFEAVAWSKHSAGAMCVAVVALLGWGFFVDFLALLCFGSVGFLASAAALSAIEFHMLASSGGFWISAGALFVVWLAFPWLLGFGRERRGSCGVQNGNIKLLG